MIRAGIISDTHISVVNRQFKEALNRAFSDCDIILHAGDITNMAVLDHFSGKTVYAVCGNMCDASVRRSLPQSQLLQLGKWSIGLCHGAGFGYNIEDGLWSHFPEADCIVYGHTHDPVCHRRGGILFINPGSFKISSPYGPPASYAVMTIDDDGIEAKLHTLKN